MPDTRSLDTRSLIYDEDCRRCDRLATFLADVRREHPTYWCKPVPPFGESGARLVIVGLAPGMHGANASGRAFTGDYAGILLYETLHRYGFATRPVAEGRGDGLRLVECRITNAVKCLPPQNKPTPAEVRECNAYLAADLRALPEGGAVLSALGIRTAACRFGHGARHDLPRGLALYDSYHCSRYNTQTRRLTERMFRDVFESISMHLNPR